MISFVTAYFDRYSKTKIFQLQGAGDEFFLPDNEVLSHSSVY
jgi:PhoPQ-activated pathogenicity-related protein